MCHACIEQDWAGNDDFATITEIYFAMLEEMISLFGSLQRRIDQREHGDWMVHASECGVVTAGGDDRASLAIVRSGARCLSDGGAKRCR
jgi:hypothetical protein